MRFKDAVVIGIWTELGLWGLFFLLYLLCLNVLVRRRGAEPIQWILLSTASVLFTLSTTHIGIQLRRLYEGLVEHAHAHGGVVAYLENISIKLNVAANAVYATMILAADSVVIYRCCLIWGKRLKVIVLPVLLLLGTAATGYATVWLISKRTARGPAFHGSAAWCGRATFILSITTNIVTTFLISYRILTTARQVSGTINVRPYLGGLAVIVETAAIYTIALTIYLVLHFTESDVQYIVLCALCPIMGIAPTLIIVRVGLGLTRTSQIDVEVPTASPPSPTFYAVPTLPSEHILPTSPIPSYPSTWSRSTHTHDLSGSDVVSPDTLDAICLQLRSSHGSGGRGMMPDDLSRNSLMSLGLDRSKTAETK